jgi:hypothetical protein
MTPELRPILEFTPLNVPVAAGLPVYVAFENVTPDPMMLFTNALAETLVPPVVVNWETPIF